MIKRVRTLVTVMFAMAILLLAGNVTNVYANELDTTGLRIINEGVLPDGGKYILYEEISDNAPGVSRITVSKTVTMSVTYSGHITPPASYAYSEYDSSYKTQMSGSLLRVSYTNDYDLLLRKETRAIYKGVIYGQI